MSQLASAGGTPFHITQPCATEFPGGPSFPALAASIKPDGSFDQSLNLTTYQAEFGAYQVSASVYQASGQPYSFGINFQYGFNPDSSQAQVNQAINGYLADPNNPITESQPRIQGPNYIRAKQWAANEISI
jgi:hypothetical protein